MCECGYKGPANLMLFESAGRDPAFAGHIVWFQAFLNSTGNNYVTLTQGLSLQA
jgi:hypothetical protein